ncbi:MAG: DUF6580 family putative transport protein [Acidobacteriota bacterium]
MQTIFIALAALLRLIPHLPNFTPIGAMALFGAAHGSRRFAIFAPLAALVASDLILGAHPTLPYVYGAFILVALVGMVIFRHGVATRRVIGASLVSSAIFFLVTNFGVWAVRDFYPHTLQGLLTCYAVALPFLRNTVAGDLFYVGVLFGGYAVVRRMMRSPTPQLAPSRTQDVS